MKIKYLCLIAVLVINLNASAINPFKKMIAISNALSYELAEGIADKFKNHDTYIQPYTNKDSTQNYYIVYLSNIKDKNQVAIELKKIKKTFPTAFAISNSDIKKIASNNFIQNNFKAKYVEEKVHVIVPKETIQKTVPTQEPIIKPVVKLKILKKLKKENKLQDKKKLVVTQSKKTKTKIYFFGLGVGASSFQTKQKDNDNANITLDNKSDETGLDLSVELGYKFSKYSFIMYNLQLQEYDNVSLYNNLISYNISSEKFPNLYIGPSVGLSYIKLTKSTSNTSLDDKLGKTFAYGGQVGYKYDINNQASLFGQYQYLKAKHETKLDLETVIIRDHNQNISFGFRYTFY